MECSVHTGARTTRGTPRKECGKSSTLSLGNEMLRAARLPALLLVSKARHAPQLPCSRLAHSTQPTPPNSPPTSAQTA